MSNIKAKQTEKLSFLVFALVSRRQLAECKNRQLLVPKNVQLSLIGQLHSLGGHALIFHISLANFVVWTDESQPFFLKLSFFSKKGQIQNETAKEHFDHCSALYLCMADIYDQHQVWEP